MKVDLHIHTTASDGSLSPVELVEKAVSCQLDIIAITDHDTINGIIPALIAGNAWPKLKIIPGVEISTDISGSEVHILGYFIDYHQKKLNSELARLRLSREGRAEKMVARLGELGLSIDYRRVLELANGGSVGRPHIAQAMLEKGYIPTVRDAFDTYIGRNGPAYVEREKMTPEEAVDMVIEAGGLPVLAHPQEIGEFEGMLQQLIAHGLIGMEVYYGNYTPQVISHLTKIAEKHHLIATGGSDFHSDDGRAGAMLGSVDVPLESAQRLIALAEKRRLVIE